MGIELELSVLLFMLTIGMVVFGRFEVETPTWRGLLKWAIIIFGTVGLYQLVGPTTSSPRSSGSTRRRCWKISRYAV